MERLYLDHQNNTGLSPQVMEAIQGALKLLGNPSSFHAEGRWAAKARETARGLVAALLNTRSEEIFFTSSGTEANIWALIGLTQASGSKGKHLIVSAVEHLSILQTTRRLEKEGWQVTRLPVDRKGQVHPEILEKAFTPETVLISLQWANGEVGTLQPMAECVRRAKARGILVHSDAVSAAGQVPVDVRLVPVDALSLAANAFGGPSGIGALFIRKGIRILPLLIGGAQEEGRRAGTENLLGIVGMGKAAELAKERLLLGDGQRLAFLRDRLIEGILSRVPEAVFNGHSIERLPGHVSVSFPGLDAETLVLALDLEGIAVGMGSACTSRSMKASHVLKAMGMEENQALGTITCTLGEKTTEQEIDRVLEILPRTVAKQRREVLVET